MFLFHELPIFIQGCLMKIALDRLLSVQFHMPRLPDVLALLETWIPQKNAEKHLGKPFNDTQIPGFTEKKPSKQTLALSRQDDLPNLRDI